MNAVLEQLQRYNIDTCACLVEFNVSAWTARRLDKGTTRELVSSKQAGSKDAARVSKHLLAGRPELDDIQHVIGQARTYLYAQTLPWSDSGARLLPTQNFLLFQQTMDGFGAVFDSAVQSFLKAYPTLITAQAMALGHMFNREEYPTPASIADKFAFRVAYIPVPKAGDFRIDIGNAAQEELQSKLAGLVDARVEASIKDAKKRLLAHMQRMVDRLATDYVGGEEVVRRFHDSLLGGAHELCALLKGLNITQDAQLEDARAALEQAVAGVTVGALRSDTRVRQDTRQAVSAIIDKFDF